MKDKKKEKETLRQIMSIIPTRHVMTEIQRKRISWEIQHGGRRPVRVHFEKPNEDGWKLKVRDSTESAREMARFNSSLKNAYVADLGTGIFRALTTGQRGMFPRVYEGKRRLLGEKEWHLDGITVWMTRPIFRQMVFGPLVDGNGRAIAPAGAVVEDAEEHILSFLMSEEMPIAHVALEADGDGEFFVVEGQPVTIREKIKKGSEEFIAVRLDPLFFPIKLIGDTIFADGSFIHQVAGLTTFLQLGARLFEDKAGLKAPLQVLPARRIILAAQMKYETSFRIDGMRGETLPPSKTKEGRFNIVYGRDIVRELYPSCVDHANTPQERIDFAKFSAAVAIAGKYYRNAANAIPGVEEYIRRGGGLIMPAATAGAEFPGDFPSLVYLKAEKI